ncbi:MAG: hypothetical protein R3C18_25875 [Planctomycetaceae bacterium]
MPAMLRVIVLTGLLSFPYVSMAVGQDETPWEKAPQETRAIVIVPNMRSFSDNLDWVASVIGVDAPHVLRTGKEQSGIDRGLNDEGCLMFWVGPRAGSGNSHAYLLPASDSRQLIRLFGNGRAKPTSVRRVVAKEFEDGVMLATEMGNYAGFAEPGHEEWLGICREAAPPIAPHWENTSPFLENHDFAILWTSPGLKEATRVKLPFESGNYVIPPLMREAQQSLRSFLPSDITEAAIGTSIKPNEGVRLSAIGRLEPGGATSQLAAQLKHGRDPLLKLAAVDSSALLLATSSCPEWNESLTQELHRWGGEIPLLTELLDGVTLDGLEAATLSLQDIQDGDPLLSAITISASVANSDATMKRAEVLLTAAVQRINREVIQWNQDAIANKFQPVYPQLGLESVQVMGRTQLNISLKFPPVLLAKNAFPKEFKDEFGSLFSMTAINEKTLLIRGGRPQDMDRTLKLIADGDNPLAAPPLTMETIDRLPLAAQQIMLLDTSRMLRLSAQSVGRVSPLFGFANGIPQWEDFLNEKATAFINVPPLGIGVTYGDKTIEGQIIIDNDLIQAAGKNTDVSKNMLFPF